MTAAAAAGQCVHGHVETILPFFFVLNIFLFCFLPRSQPLVGSM